MIGMRGFTLTTLFIGLLAGTVSFAAELPSVELAIQGRQFIPQSLEVPAGTKVLVTVHNRDALPAEFESYDLSREVVIPPGASIKVYIGPLKPGKYHFFDDFNPDAEGWITATAPAAGD